MKRSTRPRAVILVRGFNKNRALWQEWIPALAAKYRVINLDLRGHGESSLPARDFKMGIERFSDVLVEVLGGLGLSSATFVMAEFSTSVGIDLASRYPDRVDALVLPGLGYNWDESRSVDWPGGRTSRNSRVQRRGRARQPPFGCPMMQTRN